MASANTDAGDLREGRGSWPAAGPSTQNHPALPPPPSQHHPSTHSPSPMPSAVHPAWLPYNWPPAPPVYITAALDIWPRQYEREFWESATWLDSMRSLDTWFIVYATLNNIILKAYISKLPRFWMTHLQHFGSLYLAFSILHSSLAVHGSPAYYRWRSTLLVMQRGMRFLNVVMDVVSLRQCATAPACTDFLLKHMQRPGLKPLGAALRSLLIVTFIATTLIHTAYLRFSFKVQTLVQLAYVALLLRYMSVPATHLLSSQYFAAPLDRICQSVANFSGAAIREGVGAPVHLQDVCSSPAVVWNLVLFMLGFVGLVVPLVIAYCEERRTKLRYIEDELRVPALNPHCLWDPLVRVAKFAVLLAMYAACVWAVVAQYHAQIARWALPIEWPGTNMGWYRALVPGE